jgi:glucose dehydrogenase
VRGWLTEVDRQTGKVAGRAYSTGPDADVLIGPKFKPFYDSEGGKDLGVKTWPPEAQRIGGTMWGWISYDPELNLMYHGTANPGPWNPKQRPGDNKWTGGIFARDADTGEAVWFDQAMPHDLYDPAAYSNSTTRIGLQTGRPVHNEEKKPRVGEIVCGVMYVLVLAFLLHAASASRSRI